MSGFGVCARARMQANFKVGLRSQYSREPRADPLLSPARPERKRHVACEETKIKDKQVGGIFVLAFVLKFPHGHIYTKVTLCVLSFRGSGLLYSCILRFFCDLQEQRPRSTGLASVVFELELLT